jgi:hypothetical protein
LVLVGLKSGNIDAMKTLPLIVAIAVGLATASAGHAQSSASFNAPRAKAKVRNAPTHLAPRVDGAVVRAVRSGHPLQMINPGAPAEYGNGQDMVRREPNDPDQRPQGIKLFVVEF